MARTANGRMLRRRARAPAARPILVIVGLSLVLLIVLYVIWATGHTAEWYRYVAGLQGVPPFVAALFALRRIVAHLRRDERPRERRYVVGLAVFALGLLSWALAEFGLLGQGFVAATLPLYPSWFDLGPVVAIICWTAAIFIILEGHVDAQGRRFDVLEAINAHAQMLAIFLGANIALLAIFHGADFKLLLSTNGGPLTVGYALDILYTTTDVFLVWMTVTLVHGEPGRSMVKGRPALILIGVGLTVLYLADLIFTLNYAVGQREGEYLFSRYYGILPDFVYIAAIGCLSVAALLYPVAPPVFAADLARSGDASSIP